MRVHYIALLAAVLLTSADGSSAVPVSGTKRATPDLPILARSIKDHVDVPTSRHLRSYKTAARDDGNDEERAITGIGLADDVLQRADFKEWLKKGTNVDTAMTNLNLDKAGDDIFKSPQWTSYMTMLNENAEEQMTAALTRHFGSDKLATMLAAAQKVPSTKDIATKLEVAQVNRWVNTGGYAQYIFKMLKLDKGADNLFDSAALASWTSYLKIFNDKVPKKKTTILEIFKTNFDAEELLKLLVSASNANSPGATKFKNELVQSWLDFTTPPANIFKALKLDKAGDDLLTSPLLSTWVQYMKDFNKEIPRKKPTMIEQFTKSYGDEKLSTMLEAAMKTPDTEQLAKNLQSAQFKQWMVDGKSPDDIYKLC